MSLRRFLILCLISALLPTPQSNALSTSSGPTSETEAALLWKEGKSSYDSGRNQDAVNALQRYLARYPAHPHSTEASLLLGQAYFELKRFNEALGPLKNCSAISKTVSQQELVTQCELELGRTHLELKNYHEAYLITHNTKDALDQTKKESTPLKSPSSLESALSATEVEALLGLDQESKAEDVFLASSQTLPPSAPLKLRAQFSFLDLELKLRQCERFPSHGPLNQAQMQDQMDRMGTCLQEALLKYAKALDWENADTSSRSTERVNLAFNRFFKNCKHPSNQVRDTQQKQTKQELKRYRRELVDFLIQDCKKKTADAMDLLGTLEKNASKSTIPYFNTVKQNLNTLQTP